ncbi:hypothetical protein CON65_05645 [Bacillus pseudomycoides]|uniref:Lipoprotein n=1 Tax=Bacillus pseudomycoides TaxID=64104 RepID=A0AA91VEM5_9BACI|nr:MULTISPECIES: hypothetical protein [Bacillus]PEB56493.1 hypothetical protein COO03_00795 [Bacillus sp. AFS098217]PED83594.1 hypothetical protein CON65_05645 [Bacillus pseudomycoides]PEU12035.1 hypothetical protein CN524_13665 [Bacillus sp. AFS019443]PEU20230.1 hypothetical protein CN525_04860 [Bacillus sp. AFS014408]PFW63908.1 hypothetical protein COL20_07035 [Bacillus sp. AFS075034]
MKKIIVLSFILFSGITLSGCSTIAEKSLEETGNGSIKLLTPTITTKDNQLEFMTEGIDENKVTFIFVANKKVFEQKIKNDESYKLNIKGIKDAHRTNYKPKVQLLQTKDDTENGDMVNFKQVRYTVEKD